jgi:hypothetical protein
VAVGKRFSSLDDESGEHGCLMLLRPDQ